MAMAMAVKTYNEAVHEFEQISRQQSERAYLVFIDVKYQVGKLRKQSYCRILGISGEQ